MQRKNVGQMALIGSGLVAAAVGMTGCQSGVDRDEAAERISQDLEEQIGQAPDSVECSDDIPSEVGATVRCELSVDGDTLGITVTVTELVEGEVVFDYEVDGLDE